MPIQTIEPRRLYRQIADQLRGLVERGEYAVGSRLPTERELALQLGVSRPSVREALIALEVEGVVEVRMGSGIYVRSVVPGAAPRTNIGEGPLETIRARQLIEAELAANAARQMKKAQIAGLREALVLMEEDVAAGQMPTRGDRLFHVRIAESTGNSVLMQMVTALWAQARGPIWTKIEHHFHTPELRLASHADHQRIFNALLARDADASRAAMRAHIERVIGEFAQAWR